jgi:hypothetical protein
VRQLSPIEARQISQSKPIAVQVSPTAKTGQQQKSAPIVRQLSPTEARQISQSKPIARQLSPTEARQISQSKPIAVQVPLPPPPKPTDARSSSTSKILTQPGIDAIRPVYPVETVVGGAVARAGGPVARTIVSGTQTYLATRAEPPSAAQIKHFSKLNPAELGKAERSLQKQIEIHQEKIRVAKKNGGYTSAMEKEVRNFKSEIEAIQLTKKGRQ